MARGRRGTIAARVARLPIETLITAPQWVEAGPEQNQLSDDACRDLAYAYVSLTEAMVASVDDVEQARLKRARTAIATAMRLLGVKPGDHQVIQDCISQIR